MPRFWKDSYETVSNTTTGQEFSEELLALARRNSMRMKRALDPVSDLGI